MRLSLLFILFFSELYIYGKLCKYVFNIFTFSFNGLCAVGFAICGGYLVHRTVRYLQRKFILRREEKTTNPYEIIDILNED